MFARLLLIVATATVLPFAPAAAAQKFDPGSRYICPNSSDTGLDCYLDAVVHLYRMCRTVKSIEIIEFGLPEAQEGVNGAKSEYCLDKQKINITRPYQAALREATGHHAAVEYLRQLQQYWLDAMVKLRWESGEARDAYEDRLNHVYDELSAKIDVLRVSLNAPPDAAGNAKVAAPKAPAKTIRTKAAAAAAAPTAKAN